MDFWIFKLHNITFAAVVNGNVAQDAAAQRNKI